jgi:hypothetical protein
MKKHLIREKPLLDQNRYLIGLFQIIVGLIRSPNILPGKEFTDVKLKADGFERVRIQGHFDINQLPVLGLAVDVKADLPIPKVINGWLIGTYGSYRDFPAYKGRNEF